MSHQSGPVSVSLLLLSLGLPVRAASVPEAPPPPTEPVTCEPGTHATGAAPPEGLERGCVQDEPDGEPISNEPVPHGPWRTWHEDGSLATAGHYAHGLLHGDFSRWHPNGAPAAHGRYVRGEQDGTWTTWDEEGRLVSSGPLSSGVRNGTWTSWHPSGHVAATGTYVRGHREHIWRFYHPDGTLHREGRYLDGLEHGPWVTWSREGRILEEGRYHHGQKVGDWTTWHAGDGPTTPTLAPGDPPSADELDSARLEEAVEAPTTPAAPPRALSIRRPGQPDLLLGHDEQTRAAALSSISGDELRQFEPRLTALPPRPETSVDFTAYTLEQWEWKVSPFQTSVGVLDGLQVGTTPMLYAASGILDAHVKAQALDGRRADLAVEGRRYHLHQSDFDGSWTSVGGALSLRLLPAWSIHAGSSYAVLSGDGTMDACQLGLISRLYCGEEHGSAVPSETEGSDEYGLYGNFVSVRMATDIRFNRRDSLVIQYRKVLWGRSPVQSQAPRELRELTPDVQHLMELDGYAAQGYLYSTSIAWQFAWQYAHLRVGWGVGSTPLSWLPQSLELSFRFGGRSRSERNRQLQSWERNQRAVKAQATEPSPQDPVASSSDSSI